MTGGLRADDRVLQALRLLFEQLRSKYGLSEDEILSQVKGSPSVTVPVSLFADKRARPLELLCRYLKDERNLSFKEIAALLNRDYRTVWTTCSNASKKLEGKLTISASKYNLPVAIFGDRKLSVLEAVVSYLKDNFSLKIVEIASLLGRDQRNISAIYSRAKKKGGISLKRKLGELIEERADDRVLQALRLLFEQLRSKYGLSEDEILSQVKGRPSVTVPVSLFADKRARPLELLCRYLKDEHNLSYKEIAALLNRDYRTVWTTCKNASKKLKLLEVAASKYNLPASIFQDRKLSVLEAVVAHLKDSFSLKFVEIASLLRRDQRNIWTVYRRAKKKWETS